MPTVRASLGVANDEVDIDRLARAAEACRDVCAMSDAGMDLRELYQDIIPITGAIRAISALEHPTHLARGHNRYAATA